MLIIEQNNQICANQNAMTTHEHHADQRSFMMANQLKKAHFKQCEIRSAIHQRDAYK